MDEQQAARWAAAQREVEVGADLVAAARRQLEFLAAVDRRRWLYDGPLLHRAIRRYGCAQPLAFSLPPVDFWPGSFLRSSL
jgi:hypothetical protein